MEINDITVEPKITANKFNEAKATDAPKMIFQVTFITPLSLAL